MASPWWNVYSGSETGLLKGVQAEQDKWENLNAIKNSSREKQIVAISWADASQTQIIGGRKDNTIFRFDSDTKSFEETQYPDDAGALKGLGLTDTSVVTASALGCVRVWDGDLEEQVRIDAGPNLWRMRQSSDQQEVLATGGKETGLKIWNLEKPDTPTFIAKNVRHDSLELRVPVWVTDIQFLPGSQELVTCTGHHHVRLYDTRGPQRRPVVQVNFGEDPFTCVAVRPGHRQVLAGDTRGGLALMDLRKGSMVQKYKQVSGSIRGVECHPTLPIVATCGLDRFIRVHHVDTRQMLHRIYLKSPLTCLLLRDEWLCPEDSDEEEIADEEVVEQEENEDSEEEDAKEDDKLWGDMKIVGTKKQKLEGADEPTKGVEELGVVAKKSRKENGGDSRAKRKGKKRKA